MSTYEDNYLAHHGVMGQKWGVRRYQNPDGSLTAEGRIHYGIGQASTLQNHGLERMDGRSQAKLTKSLSKCTTRYGKKELTAVTMPGAINKFNSNFRYRQSCTNAAVYGIQAYQKLGLGKIGNFNELSNREAFLFGKDTAAYAQIAFRIAKYNSMMGEVWPGDMAQMVKDVLAAPDAKMDNPELESIRQAIRNSGMSYKDASKFAATVNRYIYATGGLVSTIRLDTLSREGWGSNKKYAGSYNGNTSNEDRLSTYERNKRMTGK